MLNQIEGKRQEKRVAALELADFQVSEKLKKLEEAIVQTPMPPMNEWPAAVHDFLQRSVEFAVIHTPSGSRKEYMLPVASGCVVGENEVLTCSEALETARKVADVKRGRIVILHSLLWYAFEAEPPDKPSGLVMCKVLGEDDKHKNEAWPVIESHNLQNLVKPLPNDKPKWTASPYIGQDVGFIVPSDSRNHMLHSTAFPVEFGTTIISHYRKPTDWALKVFVTAPFAGRIKQVGAGVFTRDATLLGIISEAEKYEYDAGRRAVVKTLLGFPRYTKIKNA